MLSQKYFIIIAWMHKDNKCKQKKSQNDGLLIFFFKKMFIAKLITPLQAPYL